MSVLYPTGHKLRRYRKKSNRDALPGTCWLKQWCRVSSPWIVHGASSLSTTWGQWCIGMGFISDASFKCRTVIGGWGLCCLEDVAVIKNVVVVLSPWLISEHCNSDKIRLNIHTATFIRRFMCMKSSYCQNNAYHGKLQTVITITWRFLTNGNLCCGQGNKHF